MRNYFKNLLTFLVLLSFAAASHADVVTGKVLDAQNKPVAGADILIRFKSVDSNKWQYLEVACNSHGAFSVEFSGKIDFASEAYPPVIYGVAPEKAYAIARLQPKDNILYLDDAGIVSGRVLDQNGKPVAGAEINLRSVSGKKRQLSTILKYEKPWATRFQTFTDMNGYWKLKVAPKGETAYLEVNDSRFVSADFSAQQGAKPVVVNLRSGAVISGRVVDDNDKPLTNVKVLAKEGWQEVTTNEDGIFRLTGLTPKKYHISLDAENRPIVSADIETRIRAEGETKNLPDIVMTPGGVVKGMVVNQKTGEPISGASVGSSSGPMLGTLIRLITVYTNDEGKYELRLPPGERSVFCSNRSDKYFEQSYFKTIDIQEGKTVTQNFEIDPGLTLSGTAIDGAGKPVKGAEIWVDAMSIESDYKLLPRKTITDVNGNWSISGIAPRKVQVRVGAPWATDKLVNFTLPRPTKLQLHLIPRSELPPIGRLVDTNGKPLADVEVTLEYKMPHPTPFDIKAKTVLTSDKNGYLHFRMPLVAEFPTIADVDVNDYQWITGGEWGDTSRLFSDVILDPLTRKINGRVVDAKGKAVAKARVLIVGLGKGETVTKKDGGFTLENLPDRQQLTLLAIGKAGVAEMPLSNSQKTATMHLKPLHQSFPSQAQSLDALEKLYKNSTNETEQKLIIEDIARYDTPRILKMIQGNRKFFPSAQIRQTLDAFATNNPQLALQWGNEHLPQVSEKDRIAVLCQLAKLAATQNKILAQKYFSQATLLANAIAEPEKKIYSDRKSTDSQTHIYLQSRIQLASAAADIEPAQTRKRVDEILRFSKLKSDASKDWLRSSLVSKLAVNAPQEALRVIASSDESAKIFEYQDAVEAAVTAKNSKLALYWLEQFRLFGASLDDRSSTYINLQLATIPVIDLIGPKDPKQALQLAKSADNPRVMVAAALFQPRGIGAKILSEQYDSGFIFDMPRLAGLIYDRDESEGKVLFDELVKGYWEELDKSTIWQLSASGLAYPLAQYKPHESWLILQAKWPQTWSYFAEQQAQGRTIPPARASDQAGLALAMSGADFQQAMEWARQIELQNKALSLKTQRQLLEIALATPQQRRVLAIDSFSVSDSYKPGDPVLW